MGNFLKKPGIKNVGFISTRLAGTDGVSLESEKWANAFEQEGLTCYYFAGELDWPSERSCLAEKAHFAHPDIKSIYGKCYGGVGLSGTAALPIGFISYPMS